MSKEFRKIPSLDFRYEVSKDGVVRNVKSKKIKKQQVTKFGYYRTNYSVNKSNPHYREGEGWDRSLHQLVMECWGPKRPSPDYIIDHIDRNKKNNSISNLRWVAYSENQKNRDESAIINNRLGQLSSTKKKRCPVCLENEKTGEKFDFNSRFSAAQWLIETKQSTTKNACGLARRIQTQHYVHGYKIHNINAERLCDKQ